MSIGQSANPNKIIRPGLEGVSVTLKPVSETANVNFSFIELATGREYNLPGMLKIESSESNPPKAIADFVNPRRTGVQGMSKEGPREGPTFNDKYIIEEVGKAVRSTILDATEDENKFALEKVSYVDLGYIYGKQRKKTFLGTDRHGEFIFRLENAHTVNPERATLTDFYPEVIQDMFIDIEYHSRPQERYLFDLMFCPGRISNNEREIFGSNFFRGSDFIMSLFSDMAPKIYKWCGFTRLKIYRGDHVVGTVEQDREPGGNSFNYYVAMPPQP